LTFYGLAVDEKGIPLQGVKFEFVVDSIPKDWSFDTRGQPHTRKTHTVISGDDGRIQFDAYAHIIFMNEAVLEGYRHLAARFGEESNLGIGVTSWSDLLYKSDPTNPAIYVFVKDGVKEVSALPSRGGFYAYGKQWRPNKPAWPKKPSLPDVVYKPPTTQPATTPS